MLLNGNPKAECTRVSKQDNAKNAIRFFVRRLPASKSLGIDPVVDSIPGPGRRGLRVRSVRPTEFFVMPTHRIGNDVLATREAHDDSKADFRRDDGHDQDDRGKEQFVGKP